MDNSKNVQLHEIIKNSLATYLSYKWSEDKLYLKKRKKKSNSEIKNNNNRKRSKTLERNRSIINLENDVFIYDAKTKTFTQLDLCDCFKNGTKYRKIDPFGTKPKKRKKYELCEIPENNKNDIAKYQNYQVVRIEDSNEEIFSRQLEKGDHWGKPVNTLCPSKFDLFIQKELNKCTGRNFNVKSFKINTKQESGTPSNHQVCSTAAIGYYTITTFDNALQCDSPMMKGNMLTNKKLNDICATEPSHPRKMYSKGLQCKKSSHHASRNEKFLSTNEAGIQCYSAPHRNAEEKQQVLKQLDKKITEILPHNKKLPHKQKTNKKTPKKQHSSMSDLYPLVRCKNENMGEINSSAEIRRILNEDPSNASFSLSNTGEYFRTFLGNRPLVTYYQTSSTSKEYRGDTNDEYCKKGTVVVVAASTPISPICSGLCGDTKRKKESMNTCVCKNKCCSTAIEGLDKSRSNGKPPAIKPGCSSKCAGPCNKTKTAGTHTCENENCSCVQKTPKKSKVIASCKCPSKEKQGLTEKCICEPINPELTGVCCECSKSPTTCICEVLYHLKERIRKQTEEQNRNLDQILEELTKQDEELKQIRNFVEKTKKGKKDKKKDACACYTAELEYEFTTDLQPLPEKKEGSGDAESSRSTEPEIIQIFGTEDRKCEMEKHKTNAYKKSSWRALWNKNNKNNEVKAFFVNDVFKKSNDQKKTSISSTSTSDVTDAKGLKKQNKSWLSNLFTSKKDLRKNGF